jgi:hypothetical protein
MSNAEREGKPAVRAVVEDEQTVEDARHPSGLSLEEYLPDGQAPARATAPQGMRTAQIASFSGGRVKIMLRGHRTAVDAVIAPEVDPELVADAHADGQGVLVEFVEGEAPVVVGILQTRKPREIRLRAATVHIEGEREVLLRSGRGAVRIREDGDIEVVGSRISAASRGLFRIVGRMLRLN